MFYNPYLMLKLAMLKRAYVTDPTVDYFLNISTPKIHLPTESAEFKAFREATRDPYMEELLEMARPKNHLPTEFAEFRAFREATRDPYIEELVEMARPKNHLPTESAEFKAFRELTRDPYIDELVNEMHMPDTSWRSPKVIAESDKAIRLGSLRHRWEQLKRNRIAQALALATLLGGTAYGVYNLYED